MTRLTPRGERLLGVAESVGKWIGPVAFLLLVLVAVSVCGAVQGGTR